jgi:HK97 family phage prohead protease
MLETRRAPVLGNSYDPATRTFEAIIATTAPVQRRDFEGPYNEVLDLSGELPNAMPLLNSHSRESVRDVVGRVESVLREDGALVAKIRLSGRDDVRGIGQDIETGILDAVSVGYRVADVKTEERGGVRVKTVTPQILETSLVAVPADDTARVRGAEMPNTEEYEETPRRRARAATEAQIQRIADVAGLERAFVDEQLEAEASEADARRAAFTAMETRSQATRTIRATHNDRSFDNPTARRSAMAEAFAVRMGGGEPSEQAREL